MTNKYRSTLYESKKLNGTGLLQRASASNITADKILYDHAIQIVSPNIQLQRDLEVTLTPSFEPFIISLSLCLLIESDLFNFKGSEAIMKIYSKHFNIIDKTFGCGRSKREKSRVKSDGDKPSKENIRFNDAQDSKVPRGTTKKRFVVSYREKKENDQKIKGTVFKGSKIGFSRIKVKLINIQEYLSQRINLSKLKSEMDKIRKIVERANNIKIANKLSRILE
jgi:hypothetical protein